jgi:protein O-GlcNAc transferase
MTPLTIQQTFEMAMRRHQAGQLSEAEQFYRQILAEQPEHPEATHLLGIIAHQVGQNDVAVDLIRRAIALKPNFPEAHSNLGNALKELGKLDESIAAFRAAIAMRPGMVGTHSNLGNVLKEKGLLDEALAAYRQAIALRPNYAEAYNNLGSALKEKGELDEAIAALRRAVAERAHFPEAYNNLGNALKDDGQLDDAIANYRRAVELRPSYFQCRSNLVYTRYFQRESEPSSLLKEHLDWARVHSEPLETLIQPHANDREADRRLKIGYASPDFCNHCQSFFAIPLLSNHERVQFEIYCYSSVITADSVTAWIRGYAEQWREVTGTTDEALADLVRHDKIDILVDLTMHMKGGRPLLFARKPAPVQVAWLAYPGTTGISEMDYRLTDPDLDPLDADESVNAERTIRLADSFWCYDPLTEQPLPASLLSLRNRRLKFRCLNNFWKINEAVLELWAKVLKTLPNSDLLLLAPRSQARGRILKSLVEKKIEASRIQLVAVQPRTDYLKTFQRIDLCLDTFPYNGHTTSLDSLWMGVPVVSLADGRIPVARAGISILSNMKMTALLATDHDEFVRIAVSLAMEPGKLAELRNGLRERMRRSPLMNRPRFARNMETAYRRMWRNWCEAA